MIPPPLPATALPPSPSGAALPPSLHHPLTPLSSLAASGRGLCSPFPAAAAPSPEQGFRRGGLPWPRSRVQRLGPSSGMAWQGGSFFLTATAWFSFPEAYFFCGAGFGWSTSDPFQAESRPIRGGRGACLGVVQKGLFLGFLGFLPPPQESALGAPVCTPGTQSPPPSVGPSQPEPHGWGLRRPGLRSTGLGGAAAAAASRGRGRGAHRGLLQGGQGGPGIPQAQLGVGRDHLLHPICCLRTEGSHPPPPRVD